MDRSRSRRVVVCDLASTYREDPHADVLTIEQVRQEVRDGRIFGRFQKYDTATFFSTYYSSRKPPLAIAVLLGFLARGQCIVHGVDGKNRMGPLGFLETCFAWLLDFGQSRRLMREHAKVRRELEREFATTQSLNKSGPRRHEVRIQPHGHPLYLRVDAWIGVRAGGSLAHIGGVFNNLHRFGQPPIMITSDAIPTVRAGSEMHVVPLPQILVNYPTLRAVELNRMVVREAKTLIGRRPVAFVYQRYALNGLAGLRLANHYAVPFVLEFNGSEIWVNEHWGTNERWYGYELSQEIEDLNLRHADLIVTPSAANRDVLLKRGIPAGSVIVVPNAVDPTAYHPGVDGQPVRRRLDLEGALTIGFIGTFGRWHGAEVLCDAFARLLRERPDLVPKVRLLLIGDGITRPACEERLSASGARSHAVLTGLVEQREGPYYLAACDIVVAPTVEPPDGSVFFGSPTKLFEYMAMGRAIVASGIGQVAEVLTDGETALLVPPGRPGPLAEALARLCDDPTLRARLGASARAKAEREHTWLQHTQTILDEMKARFPAPADLEAAR